MGGGGGRGAGGGGGTGTTTCATRVASSPTLPLATCVSYEEEDTCVSYEEEEEEGDTCAATCYDFANSSLS
jgi:hypothetical protein